MMVLAALTRRQVICTVFAFCWNLSVCFLTSCWKLVAWHPFRTCQDLDVRIKRVVKQAVRDDLFANLSEIRSHVSRSVGKDCTTGRKRFVCDKFVFKYLAKKREKVSTRAASSRNPVFAAHWDRTSTCDRISVIGEKCPVYFFLATVILTSQEFYDGCTSLTLYCWLICYTLVNPTLCVVISLSCVFVELLVHISANI